MKKAGFGAWLATFVVCMVFWLLLTLSFHWQKLVAGAVVSAAVALFSARFFIHEKPFHFLKPARALALFVYTLGVFPVELVKANWDVAKRALSRKLPVNPGIVAVPTKLKSEYGQSMLANSITLTPGTITMDVAEDESGDTWYYIHWIDVQGDTVQQRSDAIKGSLEPWVGRIFE